MPAVPGVRNSDWVRSPIDSFVLARLEAAGLQPSQVADRRTLLHRATFDLHGLPPTPEEIAAFKADNSPDAFANALDRLLDSPRYGERWGRYWLDVARYADTKGYVRLKDNPNYVCAWTYRDYVIRAFNEDLPYDRFILEQLAADQLARADDNSSLAAMGFLTLGQRFINSQNDIIDDRIDVTTRGLLGLTVSCARCHDHKFDPVPTADYYSLHGVFASSVEPRVPPTIVLPSEEAKYESYLKELRERTARFEQFLQSQRDKLAASFRARAGDYLLAAQREQLQDNFLPVMFLVDAAKDLNPAMVQRWGRFLEQTRQKHHPVMAPWHALAALPPDEFAAKAGDVIAKCRDAAGGAERVNRIVADAMLSDPPKSLPDTAARYGELFKAADTRWHETLKLDPLAKKLSEPAWEEIRMLLYGADAPCDVSVWEVEEYLFVDTTTQNQFHEQQRQVEDWIASPGAAPHAMVLVDAPVLYSPRVFQRGNASAPGDSVPRQFLAVLSPGERRPFQQGSGRLELAQAIADKRNPLTARVMVNRVWMHHFGTGLVRTPDDFGARCEAPTHPELLDYLAWQFMEDGWSLKQLHRRIMASAVYQQQSADRLPEKERDPENALLWKMNRRRLDWEALRDSLLAVAGNLDTTMGGPSVNVTSQPFSTRRSVYGFIDRQHLPGLLRTFDFAPPDATSPQRHQTTVPQQALFLMNSPFMKHQTRQLAARVQLLTEGKTEEQIQVLYRLLFGRSAEPEEIALGKKYLDGVQAAQESAEHLTAWEEYVQVLLLSNEFVFVD